MLQQVIPQAFVRMALSKTNTTQQNHCVPTIEESIVELETRAIFHSLWNKYPHRDRPIPDALVRVFHIGNHQSTSDRVCRDGCIWTARSTRGFPIYKTLINAETVDDFVEYLEELSVEIFFHAQMDKAIV